jgi:hypothetical protein
MSDERFCENAFDFDFEKKLLNLSRKKRGVSITLEKQKQYHLYIHRTQFRLLGLLAA